MLFRFERFYYRMTGPVKVLGGMPVFGIVTATNMSADHAESEMHPIVAGFKAFFTSGCTWDHIAHLTQMHAPVTHCLLHCTPYLLIKPKDMVLQGSYHAQAGEMVVEKVKR